jgi:hypothetical protein
MKGLIQMGILPLVVAAGVLLFGVAPASAADPCWQQVINDWADNSRVDRRYEIHCYREALRRLPEDMRAYSTAPDDIARAMREEIRRRQQESAPPPETEEEVAPPTSSGGMGTPARPKKKEKQEDGAMPYVGGLPESESSGSDGVFAKTLDEIGPSNASSFPVPLLVLGGLTGLLLLAGGVGYLAKRGALHRSRPRSPSTR